MQKWWLLGAGVIGVLLAVVMMGAPDTGGDVVKPTTAAPDAANGNPVDFKPGDAPPAAQLGGTRNGRVGQMRPEGGGNGPSAVSQQLIARRSQPDAAAASRLAGPWASIRMFISRVPDQGQRAALQSIDDDIATTVTAARTAIRDPMAADFDALFTEQRALIARVRDSSVGKTPEVTASLAAIETVFSDYETALKDDATPKPAGD